MRRKKVAPPPLLPPPSLKRKAVFALPGGSFEGRKKLFCEAPPPPALERASERGPNKNFNEWRRRTAQCSFRGRRSSFVQKKFEK